MAYLNQQYPKIIGSVPKHGAKDASLTDPIKVTFSSYLNASTITRENVFLEIDGASYNTEAVQIDVDYDSPSKTVIITPLSPLDPGVTYRVIFTKNIKSTLGQELPYEYNQLTFTTTTDGYLEQPKLVSPSDRSLISRSDPTLKWNPVDGASRYEIQISSDKNFAHIIWQASDVTDTEIVPAVPLDVANNKENLYYWRVRAYDNSPDPKSGVWSDAWVFNNAIYIDDPVALDIYNMHIIGTYPEVGEVLVPLSQREIRVRFSHEIDESTVDSGSFYVKFRAIDDDPLVDGGLLHGDIEVVGNTIIFTANEDLRTNMEYSVICTLDIMSTNGLQLEEDTMWTFISKISPQYCGIEPVRLDIKKFVDNITDEDICRVILDVSRYADMIAGAPYGTIIDNMTRLDNRDYFHNFVKYESQLRVLNRRLIESLEDKGQTKRLADLEIRTTNTTVPDINLAIRPIQAKAKEFEHLLRGRGKTAPVGVVKGGRNRGYFPLRPRGF